MVNTGKPFTRSQNRITKPEILLKVITLLIWVSGGIYNLVISMLTYLPIKTFQTSLFREKGALEM